ncbi:MAG: hypothetical protein CFE21_01025 [Bacteroidetes bacterium B1(2017)]|nr:MAG: hypothetical protein CFE21_01025 [Bacteroidetes bacterium B1(2017)]
MKKQLLALAAALTMAGSAMSQGYYYFKFAGTTSEYSMNQTGATTLLASPANTAISAAATLPFSWNFYGKAVTSFKATTSGYITFDQTATSCIDANTSLSATTAPKNSIFAFWDNTMLKNVVSGSTTYSSDIRTWTYGTAPKRVFVVQWRLMQPIGATSTSNVTYYAIRIYEGGDFDIVHNYGFGTFTASAGVTNEDGSAYKEIAGTPTMNFGGANGSYDAKSSDVYKFMYGVQPANDVAINSLDLPKFAQKNSNVTIKGKLTNYGATNLSSFKLNYAVGTDATKTMLVTGLDIPSSSSYDFTHNIPYSTNTPGDYAVKVWISNPNGGADGDSSNNFISSNITIVNSTVPRKVLHEIYTSSTCPPCNPGNAKLKSVLDAYVGQWNTIKYQVNFPGTGDPYYTAETGTRFSYYTANFAPWLVVDGSSTWGASDANANSYTGPFFEAKAAMPSLASITANFVRTGSTVTVSGNVTPVQSFNNTGLKLRIAVVETRTTKNVKTNGETEFFNVMKKMLPSAAGTAVSFVPGTAVPYTQSFTFPGTYRLPLDGQAANIINLASENSVEEFGNLFAIVFLQDDNDKTVWQSASTAPDGAMAVTEINELGLNLFPNPAKNSFEVTFNGNSSNGTVRIVDMNGREVLNQNVNSLNGVINCDNLINGLYFVELNVAGKTAVKKLNIIR